MRHALSAALCTAFIAASPVSTAQEFPARTIRMIVPFAPGGSTDVFARIVGQQIGDKLGQQVVIDNRAGAGGNIGAALAAKSAPDGYTVFFAGSPFVINAGLYGAKLPYNPTQDFSPISLIAKAPQVLTVHPSMPAHNVKQLVALSKAHPRKLSYGSGGTGTSNHLVGELFKTAAGIDIVHVPFKGGSAPAIAVLSGEIEMMISGPPTVMPNVKAGRLRAIAVSSAWRSPALPGVATMIESGLPGFDVTTWYCLVAPGGTPGPIIEKIRTALVQGMDAPQVRQKLADEGAIPEYTTPDGLAAFIRSELVIWDKAVKLSGAKID
jgi:tripartite-type tricarboxylate transporter receptor subunit TctC